MTDKDNSPRHAALQELQTVLEQHRRAQEGEPVRESDPAPAPERVWAFRKPGWRLPFNPWFMFDRRHPVVRATTIVLAALVVVTALAGAALWWRLSSGPIALDLATPWLTAAIEENFGTRYRVKVGGTQLERDSHGHTAIRLLDVVVRDSAGVTVAIAPKAEVGLSGTSLLVARPRAESLRLVDTNMLIRIEADGRVNVYAGGERPFASIAPVGTASAPPPPTAKAGFSLQSMAERSAATNVVALLAWIDGLGGPLGGDKSNVAGFDGYNLTELGITNGSLTIDDKRNGQERRLSEISLRLIRPREGGVAFSVGSASQERPWVLNAALTPGRQGRRLLQVEARKVLLDDLLALRMSEWAMRSDTLISAAIEADIGPDGTPHAVGGRVVAEGGSIGDPNEPNTRFAIGTAEFGIDWDLARRTLRMPFKIVSGAMRTTLRAEFAAPKEPDESWRFAVGGGWILLDPLTSEDEGLALKRVVVLGRFDPSRQRIALDQADFGTKELGSGTDAKDVSIALSGELDLSGEPSIALGVAGNAMTVPAFKRVWPAFVAPKVREWVLQHLISGNIERVEAAVRAPLTAFRSDGASLPEEALSVEIVSTGTTLRPVDGLPPIRDADLHAKITGRTATVSVGKGTVDVSPGRRLAVSNAVFEVPDTHPKTPPARVRLKVDGSVAAAAELLASDRLRDFSGAPFDPAGSRGTLSAQVNLGMLLRPDLPRGSTTYNMNIDLTNFSADKMLLGHKVEAQTLKVTASNQGFQMRGDVRVNGTPALLDYRRVSTEPDAELRMQATVDEAARARLGLDFGPAITGALPIKIAGRVGATEKDSRFNVELDLTPVKIDNVLPGWVKPAGRPARASFLLSRDKNLNRLDDLLIDGQGVLARGLIEIDGNGELQSANFPIFATSDGDKATLRADRGPDGALRVVMRGDVFDGRNFVKSSMAGPTDPKAKNRQTDVDLDIKLGVVAGHHGEALRSLDLRMSRRGGRIRSFALNAKIGRDTALMGDLRTRVTNNRQVLFFETNDAGALFRFTDVYPRMSGGRIWVAMDPPTQEGTPQDGIISLRDFSIRGEGALDRALNNSPENGRSAIEFSQARAEFVRSPGRMMIRDGVVRGPVIGATMEGTIDYARDDVQVRGTLVPLYGINNMFGQIPIVGLFLGGGSNEGLLGITYEVTGPTSNPRPQVNPLSAIAPGLLRKFFEFRDPAVGTSFAEPSTR